MDIVDSSLLTLNPWVTRRPITVAEYHRMGEVGILDEDDRVELIEGQLVAMAPIDSDHAGTVNALSRLLFMAVGDRGVVGVQNPVRLDNHSEPQPDFSVLKPRADFYKRSTPTPSDVLLIIEVANSSLQYDRAVKRALYARHGIREVWIVNLAGQEIEVCRSPTAKGYASMSTVKTGGTLEIEALPDATIAAASFLG